MPRNLDHRVEVVVPVDDSRARQRVNAMFDALLSDNTNAWKLNGDGSWHRMQAEEGRPPRVRAGRADAERRRTRSPTVARRS